MESQADEYTLTDDTLSVRFNYEAVSPSCRQDLEARARAIRQRLKDTASALMDIGELLTDARTKLPHGAWLPWLSSETGMSESWARSCIRLYRRFHDQPLLLGGLDIALPPTAIIRLASAPSAALEDVQDHLIEGRRLRVADVEAIIKRHRKASVPVSPPIQQSSSPRATTTVQVGEDALHAMALKALDELIPLVVRRLQQVRVFLEDAEDRLQRGEKIALKEMQSYLRDRCQWLTDALEQITQRRASSTVKLVHSTFVHRQEYEAGPWAATAAFLRDVSSSAAWEKIKAADVAPLIQRGREALQTVLPPPPPTFQDYV